MFNSLTGIITAKFPKQVFIDTNGVEWDLCVPDSNLDMLPPVGSEARIFTWLQHTDQLMTLYGFASADERSLFLDLLFLNCSSSTFFLFSKFILYTFFE